MSGGSLSTPDGDPLDEIDHRVYIGDRLGLSGELAGNESYAVFCWHAPMMIPHGELRALWDAMSHLGPEDVRELLHVYLVGKERERLGVIGMLKAGVPVRFMVESGVDPRLELAEGQLWGWRDVVVLWRAGVPYEALDRLVGFNIERKTVVPAEGVAAMTRAGVPLPYMMELLGHGVEPEAVARAWGADVPAEYGAAAFHG